MGLIIDLLKEMRPKQWYKNALVFLGLIFSGTFIYPNVTFDVALTFVAFCAMSGSVYIVNDFVDRKADMVHPVKRNRPIASGRLNPHLALIVAAILIWAGLFTCMWISVDLGLTAMVFLIVCILYSYALKRIFLVDVLTISLSLVIRAVAGCVAIGVLISPWLIICTFAMALFMALCKRRHELILLSGDAASHRPILKRYSIGMLNTMIGAAQSGLVLAYFLYVVYTADLFMLVTIPLVVYGVKRYADNALLRKMGGEPELMFRDPTLIACVSLWVAIVFAVESGFQQHIMLTML